ncbi:MAG: VTT domain-containing protein [Gemmatimonadota bacterium]|nr:VTT domain-containing protein [Gemmatimonadota bacterium]MDH4350427.1 VTT domain-containing protein [Gemmatimonadota bacterium]MDH5196338.1 VTT domain-containing protein [Gemmatimonadota bacterium]
MDFLRDLGHLLTDSGALAYVLAPLFMILVAILPLPAEVPAMVNGMVFGPALGAGVTWAGGLVGAVISFEIARRWGRPAAERFLPKRLLDSANRFVHAAGWSGLLAARLIPTVAFTALNWGLGLSAIPRRTFLWTTALGILPGAVAFTLMGTGLGAFYRAHPVAGGLAGTAILIALVSATIRLRRAGGNATQSR